MKTYRASQRGCPGSAPKNATGVLSEWRVQPLGGEECALGGGEKAELDLLLAVGDADSIGLSAEDRL